jgi:hypothetical protein
MSRRIVFATKVAQPVLTGNELAIVVVDDNSPAAPALIFRSAGFAPDRLSKVRRPVNTFGER